MYCECLIESVIVEGPNLKVKFTPIGAYRIEHEDKTYALFVEKTSDLEGEGQVKSYEAKDKLEVELKDAAKEENSLYAGMLFAAKVSGSRIGICFDKKTLKTIECVSLI